MGVEMDCPIESPLDVLSRAASMIQNEEREAALKRSVDSSSRPPTRSSEHDQQPHKRMRESPPTSSPDLSPRTSYNFTHSSHSSTYADSTSPSSSSQLFSSHHTSSLSQQHQSAASSSSSSHQHSSVSTTSSQPHPWQPFTHPAPQSPPHPTLPSPHLPPPPPYIDSNMPLNLSVSSSSSSSHIGHSAAARQASLPRASLMATTGAPSSSRGEDSSSPGVPESVAGRRVMTYNGLVFYPTPVHGASLPNMEAKTHRDVDSDTCDPTIEEHFRRSLGNAYAPAMSKSRTPSPPTANHVANNRGPVGGGQVNGGAQDPRVKLVSVSGAVDEHFAKSLGQKTWSQLQVQESSDPIDPHSVDAHFTKALGDTWLRIKAEQDVTSRPQHGGNGVAPIGNHHPGGGHRANTLYNHHHHPVAPPSVQ